MDLKVNLPERIAPQVLARLARVSMATRVSYSDVISLALDALERQERAEERLEKIEQSLAVLVETATGLHWKMDQARETGRTWFNNLGDFLRKEIRLHDEAEQARFSNIKQHDF